MIRVGLILLGLAIAAVAGADPRPVDREVRRVSTPHLDAQYWASPPDVAPGRRVSLILEVHPRGGVHIYAPPETKYRSFKLRIEPRPELRLHMLRYPRGEIYEFKPLEERVVVYQRPFRIVQDVTLEATPEIRARAVAGQVLTIAGAVEYQACNDTMCFAPTKTAVTWSLGLIPVDATRRGSR